MHFLFFFSRILLLLEVLITSIHKQNNFASIWQPDDHPSRENSGLYVFYLSTWFYFAFLDLSQGENIEKKIEKC